MKILPLVNKLFHTYGETDGRTDMTALITTFRNFAKALIQRFCLAAQASWTCSTSSVQHSQSYIFLVYKVTVL